MKNGPGLRRIHKYVPLILQLYSRYERFGNDFNSANALIP